MSNKKENREIGLKFPRKLTLLLSVMTLMLLGACTDLDNGEATASAAPEPVLVDTEMTPTPDASEDNSLLVTLTPFIEETVEPFAAGWQDSDGTHK